MSLSSVTAMLTGWLSENNYTVFVIIFGFVLLKILYRTNNK